MRSIRFYLLQFLKEEAKPAYLLFIFLMLGILIYLNYWHALEHNYVDNHSNWFQNFVAYFLLYIIPFIISFAVQPIFFKGVKFIRTTWFWVVAFLAPIIFAFRVNTAFIVDAIVPSVDKQLKIFYSDSLTWIVQAVAVIIPLYFIWKIKDSRSMQFYGTTRLKKATPYFLMILLMIPLITLAATQQDFLRKYPRANVLLPLQNITDYYHLILFEISYGLSFLSIEFFFRGFLVLTLLKYCGTKSIIPIACFYVAIHMGKPMAEAISSFFGGILLGLVTYHTRSIWGGLIVHLGIAWMMELAGSIARQL